LPNKFIKQKKKRIDLTLFANVVHPQYLSEAKGITFCGLHDSFFSRKSGRRHDSRIYARESRSICWQL